MGDRIKGFIEVKVEMTNVRVNRHVGNCRVEVVMGHTSVLVVHE